MHARTLALPADTLYAALWRPPVNALTHYAYTADTTHNILIIDMK
jgi:hypothetical protein